MTGAQTTAVATSTQRKGCIGKLARRYVGDAGSKASKTNTVHGSTIHPDGKLRKSSFEEESKF